MDSEQVMYRKIKTNLGLWNIFFFFFFLQSDRLRKESNGWELKTNVNKVAKTS